MKLGLIETNCHPRAGGDPAKKELMAKPPEQTYLERGRDPSAMLYTHTKVRLK